MNGYRQVARAMKALAHPVRLQILEVLLAEGEACVCHLEARLHHRQAYISQQLSKLREAGLVVDRRDGLNIFYSIRDDGIASLLSDAKRLAVRSARADGLQLAFPPILEVDSQRCKCPKCEQKVALASQG